MPRTSARPPSTRVEPVQETLHGTAITDNYRWLKGNQNQPVVSRREGHDGQNKVLVDPARLDDSGLPTVQGGERHPGAMWQLGTLEGR